MATPSWSLVSTLLADLIDAKGQASIDMNGQSARMKQYIRRKVITRWYNRNRFEDADLNSETKGGVVTWIVSRRDASQNVA